MTLTRAVLVCGVTALVVDGPSGPRALSVLVLLASVALALDAVDGPVARRTGSISALGGRFDMEVDAFLILVLSVQVARDHGPWVLAIGAARYLLLVAGWWWPWLRVASPPRYWGKVVAAVQGVVLVVAASGLLPAAAVDLALLGALALLAESFGREVGWKWRHRHLCVRGRRRPARVVAGHVVALAAGLGGAGRPGPLAGTGRPRCCASRSRGCCWSAWCCCCRPGPRGCWPRLAGLALALLTLLRLLDVGFAASLERPFDPLYDWGYAGSGGGAAPRLGRRAGRGRGARRGGAADSRPCWSALPAAVLRVTALARRHRGGVRPRR